MKKSVMEKWTKELESGRYRQVTGVLKKPRSNKAYGYCCLGVLCDIYARETGKGIWEDDPTSNQGTKRFNTNKSQNATELPEEVRKWAGMDTASGQANCTLATKTDEDGDEFVAHSLIDANDDLGLKFPQIAQVIRKNYKKL
jgi:hypothetical protein